jgi:hypothetical protein
VSSIEKTRMRKKTRIGHAVDEESSSMAAREVSVRSRGRAEKGYEQVRLASPLPTDLKLQGREKG